MTFIGLFLQSFLLFIVVVLVLLTPLVTGGYPGELTGALASAFLLTALMSYVLFHRSSYSSLKEETTDSLLTRASWLKSAALAARVVTAGTLIFAGGMLALYLVAFFASVTRPPPSEASIAIQIMYGFASAFAIVMYGIAAVLSYLALFFVPFFIALPIAASVGRRWKNPGRFLLLRPFNRRYATRPLRTIIRDEIAYFGHTYTLADESIKVPWYIRIPVFVGQSGFLQFRIRKIKNQKRLIRLEREMENRWSRNLNWSMSWGKVFAVATIDKFWKACVTQMIPVADAIFIDLSELRDNVLWEVEQCQRMGATDRIVFLVRDENYAEAKRYLADYFGDGQYPSRLFQYTNRGTMVDKDFQPTLVRLLTNLRSA